MILDALFGARKPYELSVASRTAWTEADTIPDFFLPTLPTLWADKIWFTDCTCETLKPAKTKHGSRWIRVCQTCASVRHGSGT